MRHVSLVALVALLFCVASALAQDPVRKVVSVPKVDPAAMTIDGKMDEVAWQNAARADLVTDTGYEVWANKYYREDLAEPEFDALYARMLWADDTLYVFMHIDEFVNDSTDLFFGGKAGTTEGSTHWGGDQLYIGLSSRFGVWPVVNWEGAPWAAPDGPYHLMIMGDHVTFNDDDTVWIPEDFRGCPEDSMKVFNAADILRSAVVMDPATGLWDVELAIYSPSVRAQGAVAFNVAGSTGSAKAYDEFGDAYGYYIWQPNVPGDPWANAVSENWNTYYIQQDSRYWAKLVFEPAPDEPIVRKSVDVPRVDAAAITIDGKMDEPAWQTAARADLVTDTGYEVWANKYYREDLAEPEFDALYARMLWSEDTLFVFMHIDEFVNDSTDLFFGGKAGTTEGSTHWGGDQLYIGLSNRFGVEAVTNWEGAPWAAPDGPYHLMIMGDHVTFNDDDTTWIPEEFRKCFADSMKVFSAADILRSAVVMDPATGLWDVELAIYSPNARAQAVLGFNVAGSTGSAAAYEEFGDAYGYYIWQPHVPGDPWANAVSENWNTYYIQQDSKYWAALQLVDQVVSVDDPVDANGMPTEFRLAQNYPNPFNPSTTITYALPRAARVTMTVHNVLGQTVATLVDAQRAAGVHFEKWDAGTVSSGVYFIRLKADDQLIGSRKMMLLK